MTFKTYFGDWYQKFLRLHGIGIFLSWSFIGKDKHTSLTSLRVAVHFKPGTTVVSDEPVKIDDDMEPLLDSRQ